MRRQLVYPHRVRILRIRLGRERRRRHRAARDLPKARKAALVGLAGADERARSDDGARCDDVHEVWAARPLRRWRRRGAVLALDGIVESCDPGQAVIGYDRFLKADEAGW